MIMFFSLNQDSPSVVALADALALDPDGADDDKNPSFGGGVDMLLLLC